VLETENIAGAWHTDQRAVWHFRTELTAEKQACDAFMWTRDRVVSFVALHVFTTVSLIPSFCKILLSFMFSWSLLLSPFCLSRVLLLPFFVSIPFYFFYSLSFLPSFSLFILLFYFHFFCPCFVPTTLFISCFISCFISFSLLSFSLSSHAFITHIRAKDSGLSFVHTCNTINTAPPQTAMTTLWSKLVSL